MRPPERSTLERLMKAADFAARRHRFQKRKDVRQTPYINHPSASVAHLLTSVGGITDTPTLVAALLHDTIEDTKTTAEEIEREFGAEVREIVQEARLVHLADKLYNLNDLLRAVPLGHVKEYVESARALIAKIKGTNDQLEAAVDDAINQLLSKN
ncbi:HD domain-containing protein [Aphelenchoides fujianensis]|nr:HD domain-containing protein [Aphelenchoides fujianensis]